MRNILILITLISGLIFTSLIKNKTRLLEKELLYLDNEINSLSSNLAEATLDFQYLTTPKYISFLVKNYLDENFTYYKESQIKKSIKIEKDSAIFKKSKNKNTFIQSSKDGSSNKKLKVVKKIETQITGDAYTGEETVKYLAILKKTNNDDTFTFSQLSTDGSVNKKLKVTQDIENEKSIESKKIAVSKKVYNWTGLQIVKSLFGIPTIPVK